MSEHVPTDEELLWQMVKGDEGAFTALYRRRQAGVYRFALQMTGSESLAEDVTQEVFLALMRAARRYDPKRGSVAAFLYGIARNQVHRFLKRSRPERESRMAEEAPAEDDPHGELTRRESIESVRAAVLRLPAHYREALVLCDLHEMSYEGAAAALGCAVGTVRSRLHRARAMLAERLSSLGEAAPQKSRVNAARCFI